jgi:hypothetical protein
VARWVGAGAIVASLTACNLVAVVVTMGPISQQTAEDTARFSSGVSVAPVAVVFSRLSTYGAEHPGGSLAAPEGAVWAVTLSGGFFPESSCTAILGFASPSLSDPPCRPPSPPERVLVDAWSGHVIEIVGR